MLNFGRAGTRVQPQTVTVVDRIPITGPSGSIDADLAAEWDTLADQVDAAPWLRPGWCERWWRAFGDGRLSALTVRRAGRLVAVAPLAVRGRVLASPTNYHSPAYAFVALDQPAADDLAAAAVRWGGRGTSLAFVHDADTTHAALVRAARRCRHLHASRTLEEPPYVETTGDWPEYEDQRDAKLTRDLRRRERRLRETGAVTFEVHEGRFGHETLLQDCFKTEAAGWKGTGGTAIDSQPATRRFYTEVAEYARARGELMLAFLRLDDRAIAMQLNISFGGTVTVLKLGHDETYARYAPGKLLIRHVLQACFRGPTALYDFSGQADAYKLEWADDRRPLVEVRTFAPSPVGVPWWAAERFGRPLAKRVLGR